MGRRKTGKRPILLSIGCLSDIFIFYHGDIQMCQSFSLVNRQFFLAAKKYLYKDNARRVHAIYLRSEFYGGKFIYHILFKSTLECTKGFYGHRNTALETYRYAYHWGGKCCQKVPMPNVSPPSNILGIDKIMIEDFVGTGTEAFTFLRCSKRLFAGKKCLLSIGNYRTFLERHSSKRLDELINLFGQCFSLTIAYSESIPENYEFMATRLINCNSIRILYTWPYSSWDELRSIVVPPYAKMAIGNLLRWLHYDEGKKEVKPRTLFCLSRDHLTPNDYQTNPPRHFDQQLFEAIKKKFTAATEPCTFCVHLGYYHYNSNLHDARSATNRVQQGNGLLDWVERMENERTGEVLEHFIYTEIKQQKQHRIWRRRDAHSEESKFKSFYGAEYHSFDESGFDTVIELLIDGWKSRKFKFGK